MIEIIFGLTWALTILLIVYVWSVVRHDCERTCYERPDPSLDDLAARIRAFGIRTFPTSTPESTAEHLRREVMEILADPSDGEEQADAFFLLVQLSRVTGTDLAYEVERKLAINLARTWKKPDSMNVVEHVKEEVA